jgi:hypothetical protein
MAKRRGDDLRSEYDLATLESGVRGKYCKQAVAGTNLVLLESDVARAFPDSRAVNRALHAAGLFGSRDAGPVGA